MGFGRAKANIVNLGCLAALFAAGAALAGCSADGRENEPRPPIPAGISIQVTGGKISLAPGRVGFGPVSRQQVIADERDGEIQGPPDQPLPVNVTIANTTPRPLRVELVGPSRRISPVVTATGTATMSTRLPSGIYRVRVAGRKGSTARLVVGPDRSSPQNDLMLP